MRILAMLRLRRCVQRTARRCVRATCHNYAGQCRVDKREQQQAERLANANIDCAFWDAFGIMRIGV